jgi:hypothetical protein
VSFSSSLWLACVALLLPACDGCSGNGHVVQTAFYAQPGDDVVNCVCNLTFDNEHCSGGHCAAHFAIQLCIPPSLQADGGAALDLGPPPGDGGVDDYSSRINRFCSDTATHVVYHMIKVFNGGWCDYKAPYAPDGGIGRSVICFAQEFKDGEERATSTDDGTCRTQCQTVPCDYATNCGSDVQDSSGNVHPDRCKCSIVTKYGCPGDPPSDLPTALFCRPPGQ